MPFLTSLRISCPDDEFPFSVPSIRALEDGMKLHPKVTFLVGENGMGKSTLLDEPEAALSPTRQKAFLVRLHDLVEDFSQFIIATHSPIILAYPISFALVIRKCRLEIVGISPVVNEFHNLSSDLGFKLVPRPSDGRIALHLGYSS